MGKNNSFGYCRPLVIIIYLYLFISKDIEGEAFMARLCVTVVVVFAVYGVYEIRYKDL
jgi:hypothetical protein